ncbi:unnamed protein product [Blepharisma stoltei]|uniref:Palmitoyltransferase n=1 Tax=Blepharisma stoltei TaxID=1481888 RepID=A0AAU9J2R6_9CILI|nr:unnamed protein product [Blepharisma stoltei]
MKKNGLDRPYHPLQVLSWIGMTFSSVLFYTVYLPYLPSDSLIIIIILYTFTLIGTLYSGIRCTISNPTDPYVQKSKSGEWVQPSSQRCSLCNAYTMIKSKHCARCCRCVNGFDHHCKWLNNCIGSKNYKWFFNLIAFCTMMSLTQAGSGVYIFIDVLTSGDTGKMIKNRYNADDIGKYSLIGLIFVASLLCLLVSIFLAHLFIFHVYLHYLGLTTYDYILMKKEKTAGKVQVNSVNMTMDTSFGEEHQRKVVVMEESPIIKRIMQSKAKKARITPFKHLDIKCVTHRIIDFKEQDVDSFRSV